MNILKDLELSVRRFFDLPVQIKKKYLKENSPSDAVAFGTSFSPQTEKVLEWKDSLTMLYESDEQASQFWPPVCREEGKQYMKGVEVVIKRLIEVLLKKLNAKEIDKEKEHMLMGAIRLHFNYYPSCPNPELAQAIGSHSDISTITVLHQDETGGLYARGEGESWIYVPPVNGALVINVGDVLQILSNDLYKSIEHRAVANKNKSRISIPVFVNPGPDAVIGPLPEILENGEKPVYKQVVYSDYLKQFFSKPYGKMAIEFAKIH